MSNEIKPPTFEVYSFLPDNFFNKNVNEEFILIVMKSIFGTDNWRNGNANKQEPDFMFNDAPFEFTLASDKCKNKKKDNFINKLREAKYKTDNSEDDAINYIEQQIEDKSKKKYSVPDVNLCVLCLIESFGWISDEYGSCMHFLTDIKRERFFASIKAKYIDANLFNDIFIIFPDMSAKWWVWSIKFNSKWGLPVSPQMIESEKYPYFIEKRLLQQLVDNNILSDKFKLY